MTMPTPNEQQWDAFKARTKQTILGLDGSKNGSVVVGEVEEDGSMHVEIPPQTTSGKTENRFPTPEESVLSDAATTISSGRQDDYGNAEDSFATIAELFSTFLTARTGQSV